MRSHVYRTEAIVLRRTDYGEADRILTLYTPRFGKRRAIAKGVRKTTSRIAGHIELFTRSNLMLAEGRNLDIVTQAEIIASYRNLREDLQRISYAYYIAELLDKLTEDEEGQSPAYGLLAETLDALDTAPHPLVVVRRFELRLLGVLGYRPYLFHCASCQEDLTEADNRWTPNGGMLCARCAGEDPGTVAISLPAFKTLRFMQREPLEAVLGLRLSENVLREIEELLQLTIKPILERDLKSVKFVRAVQS
jgi:DNA repair protein RecO (recombination protein O)